MDAFIRSMELNKIATAILLSALIIVTVSNVVDMIYNPGGHIIEITDDNQFAQKTQEEVKQVVLDIEMLMQNANFEKGKLAAKKCIACHSFEKGGPNRVGPNLWNIFGRKKAHLSSTFNYSKAMLGKGGNWGYKELFEFLKNPKAYIKGTNMGFAGISNLQEIANLISYLRTINDNLQE